MRLQLTRRADYAIRAMLVLARDPNQVVSGQEIAREMSIPERLVTQVMGRLVHAGLVRARLGRHGGYWLGSPADEIPMLSIVEAVEGDSRRQRCVLRGLPCVPDERCQVHDIFAGAQEALIARLADASLGSALRS